MNIGYDNGEGLGVSGDGIITFDEIQHVVGECRVISEGCTMKLPRSTIGAHKER